MARYAVIDVGTNSVKFHIGEKHGAAARHAQRAERRRTRNTREGSDREPSMARLYSPFKALAVTGCL